MRKPSLWRRWPFRSRCSFPRCWCLAVDAFAQLTNVACRGNGGRGRAAARACSQAGQKWHDTPPGLPNVTVTDLVLVPERGVLYAGTHGQGVWQLKVH
jgi:hypothetical protein